MYYLIGPTSLQIIMVCRNLGKHVGLVDAIDACNSLIKASLSFIISITCTLCMHARISCGKCVTLASVYVLLLNIYSLILLTLLTEPLQHAYPYELALARQQLEHTAKIVPCYSGSLNRSSPC